MADAVPGQASLGQQLLAKGLRQGSWFSASSIPEALLREWAEYRSEPALRQKFIKANALLVVVSQDCDIASRHDRDEPCIELAVFKPIKPRQLYGGNQFAHSVRKLQFSIGEKHYEAKARETVRVPKQDLHDCLMVDSAPSLSSLMPEQCRTLVLWRANRYQREALPDRFNLAFQPLLDQALPELECIAQDPADGSRSYIRALYVYLDHLDEQGDCGFSLMVLLRSDTPDHVQSDLDDEMETLCQALEATNPAFRQSEQDSLAGLAERESTLTVVTLGQYVKYNLDAVSLSHGDPDVGV